jgi:hypothetical protein
MRVKLHAMLACDRTFERATFHIERGTASVASQEFKVVAHTSFGIEGDASIGVSRVA